MLAVWRPARAGLKNAERSSPYNQLVRSMARPAFEEINALTALGISNGPKYLRKWLCSMYHCGHSISPEVEKRIYRHWVLASR